MRAGSRLLCVALAAGAAACHRAPAPDAYGNVEATEVVVSAEATGRLLSFDVEEGQRLAANAVVGAIDDTPLVLQRDQLMAQRDANASRANEVAAQAEAADSERRAAQAQAQAAESQKAALEAQVEIAQRAYDRTQRLFAQQAATSQQLDQAEKDLRVLQDQVTAQNDQIASQHQQVDVQTHQAAASRTARGTAAAQTAAVDAQIAQVNDRIQKSRVRNPSAGTVLATYARTGEMAESGQPLYKVANLDAVDVRAYITEPQLSLVRLGQPAQVTIDAGPDHHAVTGTITWISSQSEFTPTPIQTRDERADLVYAIKIRVPNADGQLKIGMPVDVEFAHGAGGQ